MSMRYEWIEEALDILIDEHGMDQADAEKIAARLWRANRNADPSEAVQADMDASVLADA